MGTKMNGWTERWMVDGWTGGQKGEMKKEPQFLEASLSFQLLLITWPKT